MHLLPRNAISDRDHFDGVAYAITAQGPTLPGLVGKRERCLIEIQMPAFARQVRRLDRTSALLMDHIQGLHKFDVVAHIGISPSAPAAVEIIGKRRPAY